MRKFAKKVQRIQKRATRRGKEVLMRSGSFLQQTFVLLLASLSTLMMIWGGFYYYTQYLQVLPSGASLSGVDLSGLRRPEAAEVVRFLMENWEDQEIEMVVSENGANKLAKNFSVSEVGLRFDPEATVSQLFQTGDFEQADVLHGVADLSLPATYLERDQWQGILDWVKSHERPMRNAAIVFDEDEQVWVLHDSQVGLALLETDEAFLKDQLFDAVRDGFHQSSLEVVLERVEPEVSSEDLFSLFEKIESLSQRTFEWRIGDQKVSLSLTEHPHVLSVDLERKAIVIDENFLDELLDHWSESLEREAGTVVASVPIEQALGYYRSEYDGSFTSGMKIDREKIRQKILSDLQESVHGAEELPVLQLAPSVEMEGVGALSLLSRGVSSYELAPDPDRTFNVKFGLEKYDGVVIPQGAEFSFNQVLGWVTYEAGWKPALAIFGGGGVAKVPGGGLCQVSTTMYRAVINSGLPVTDRKPHSLDVSYYQEYGYGIDSTVYPPEDIDLKFVNDTPGPIFIHTAIDEVNKEVIIEFYGIDDGREVELKQVINRSVILPNQVSYTSDISTGFQEVLQKGRQGRYIEWEWNITRADGSVEKRTIETLYPAAARVVRVGTGG